MPDLHLRATHNIGRGLPNTERITAKRGLPVDQELAGNDTMVGSPVRRPQAARGRAAAGPSGRRKEGKSARRGP